MVRVAQQVEEGRIGQAQMALEVIKPDTARGVGADGAQAFGGGMFLGTVPQGQEIAIAGPPGVTDEGGRQPQPA